MPYSLRLAVLDTSARNPARGNGAVPQPAAAGAWVLCWPDGYNRVRPQALPAGPRWWPWVRSRPAQARLAAPKLRQQRGLGVRPRGTGPGHAGGVDGGLAECDSSRPRAGPPGRDQGGGAGSIDHSAARVVGPSSTPRAGRGPVQRVNRPGIDGGDDQPVWAEGALGDLGDPAVGVVDVGPAASLMAAIAAVTVLIWRTMIENRMP